MDHSALSAEGDMQIHDMIEHKEIESLDSFEQKGLERFANRQLKIKKKNDFFDSKYAMEFGVDPDQFKRLDNEYFNKAEECLDHINYPKQDVKSEAMQQYSAFEIFCPCCVK